MSNETRDIWIKSIDEQILELQRQKEELQQMPNESANKDEFIDVSNLLRDANISIQNILIGKDYSVDDLFEIRLNHHTKLVRYNALLSLKILTEDDKIIYTHNNYAYDLDKWLNDIVERAALIAQSIKDFKGQIKNQQDYRDQFVLKSKDCEDLDIRVKLSKSFEDRLNVEMYYDFNQNDYYSENNTIPLGGNFAIEIYGSDPEAYLSYKDKNLTIDGVSVAIAEMKDRIGAFDII